MTGWGDLRRGIFAMKSIALPDRNIILPRLEFPRWLRFPRGVSDERVARMLAPLGGMLTPLGVSGAKPFSPADIAGLQLWLKADAITGLGDGDAITTWTDSSGNGNNATQSTSGKKPLYKTNIQNGLPAVRFDGSDDAMTGATITGLGTSSISLFVTANGGAIAANQERVLFGIRGYTDGFNFERSSWGGRLELYNNNASIGSGDGLPNSGFSAKLLAVVKDYGVRVTLFINGENKNTSTNATLCGTFTNGSYDIGDATLRGDDRTYLGDIFEVILYNVALTDSQRQNIENYLNTKWALW